jgi:hypothetical protein
MNLRDRRNKVRDALHRNASRDSNTGIKPPIRYNKQGKSKTL